MDHTHRLEPWVLLDLVPQHLGVNCFAPWRVHQVHGGAATLRYVAQADAEVTVAADKNRVARLYDVDAGGLHGSCARGRDGHGHLVAGVKDLPKHIANVVHHLKERRVKVSDHWSGHRLQHPGMHRAGPRPEQNLAGRLKFFHVGASQSWPPVLWTFS